MDILYLISGVFVGLVVGYLVFSLFRQKFNTDFEQRIGKLDKENSVLKDRQQKSDEIIGKLNEDLQLERSQNIELNTQVARADTEYKNLQEKLDTQKEELQSLQKKFTTEFENIAGRILKQHSADFTEVNQKNIDEILKPLKEKMSGFEQKVQETYEKSLQDRTKLRTELQNLMDLNKQISEEANNLTRALKSDTKKMGNWGELILDRILEQSGLIKGEEYYTQYTDHNEKGEMIRPDVVIQLPEKKNMIIDSKVSLVAYEAFVNADDEEARTKYLKAHLHSIREHIKGLSEKNYHQAAGLDTPDFVLLFMPLESAFGLALQNDPELFSFAWQRKIVIVSPTTLLATLKTVEAIWKHEKQTRNAMDIAIAGGNLYDKFYNFMLDLQKIGTQIDGLQKTYGDAYKKIADGRGNLLMQVERLKKLGVKTEKSLSDKFDTDETDLLPEE